MKELTNKIDKNWKLKVSQKCKESHHQLEAFLNELLLLLAAAAASAASSAAAASAAAAAAYAIWDSLESWNQRAIFAPRSPLHKFHNTHQH